MISFSLLVTQRVQPGPINFTHSPSAQGNVAIQVHEYIAFATINVWANNIKIFHFDLLIKSCYVSPTLTIAISYTIAIIIYNESLLLNYSMYH